MTKDQIGVLSFVAGMCFALTLDLIFNNLAGV